MRALFVLLLCGCAAPGEYEWVHDAGADRARHERDFGQCEAQALGSHPALSTERGVQIFGACMRGKGWRLVER